MKIPNYRLSRKPYFILRTLYEIAVIGALSEGDRMPVLLLLVLVSLPLSVIFISLPRARDCDWPALVAWLTLVPVLSYIPAITLLWGRSKVFFRRENEVLAEDPT